MASRQQVSENLQAQYAKASKTDTSLILMEAMDATGTQLCP